MTIQETQPPSPGTDEAAQTPDSAPQSRPDTSKAVAETLARLRADTPTPNADARTFAEKLAADGIEATKKEKPPEVEPEPEAVDEPEVTPLADDALDEFVDVATSTRDSKVNAAHDIQAQLEAKGMKPSLAKAMAHHGSRKDAEEFLANYGNPVQSEPAGQPAPADSKAPEGVELRQALAEVQSKLSNELGGEETATAVTGVLSQMMDRLQVLEGTAQQSAAAIHSQEKANLRTTAQQVTGELQGQFPQLVRDGKIDPAVMETAAAMFDRGHTQGDLDASIRSAAHAVYGSQTAPARQTPIDSTPEPELSAPDDVRSFGNGPVSKHEEQALLTEVFRQYSTKPEQRKAALNKTRRMIDRRNAAARK